MDATTIANLQAAMANYSAAILNDSLNPGTDYSLDGQTVNRNQWRQGMFKMIQDMNQQIIAAQPYQFSTKQVL